MIVVSDTSPICYLLLIGEIDLLPRLYGQVLIPQVVYRELAAPQSPSLIRDWLQVLPSWLKIQTVNLSQSADLNQLDPGEIAAILLAEQQEASLLIVDDLLGRRVAISRGLNVTGLLGVLNDAAEQGLIDFPTAINKLEKTTFRASPNLVQSRLDQHT